jgi:hypothetical protein
MVPLLSLDSNSTDVMPLHDLIGLRQADSLPPGLVKYSSENFLLEIARMPLLHREFR